MKKLLFLLTIALFNAQVSGMDEQAVENGQTAPSMMKTCAKTAGLHTAGTIASAALGGMFHVFSGNPEQWYIDIEAMNEVNLVRYPSGFYSKSIPKYYASKFAHGLLVTSSALSAPLRSLVCSVAAPVWYAKEILKASHALKDPNASYHDNLCKLRGLKREAKRDILKAPVSALVGFGVPVAAQQVWYHVKMAQENGTQE